MKSPIQPLQEQGAKADRAMQTLDGKVHKKKHNQPNKLKEWFIINITMAHASIACSKTKV